MESAAHRLANAVRQMNVGRIDQDPFAMVAEGKQVIDEMARHGLRRGENGLEVFVMCEIPNNVIEIDAFAALFDGFSIGSNDLTQLIPGVDRDSDDERDPGMLDILRLAVSGAKRNHRHIGICGEAPANYPEIARFLAEVGIDSISVNAASLLRTMSVVYEAEQVAARTRAAAE
jgi:pyruvate, water dikinase